MALKRKDLLGLRDITRGEIEEILKTAETMMNDCYQTLKLALLIEWKRKQRFM